MPSEELSKMMTDYQQREKELEIEIRAKDETIKRLERDNQKLVKDYS